MIGRKIMLATCVFLAAIDPFLATNESCAGEPPRKLGTSGEEIATRDIVYYHRDAPVFIRVHLEVDDASFEAPWRQYVRSLFSEIDADSDGRVTPAEVTDKTASSTGNNSADVQRLAREPGLWTADRNPFDGSLTLEELAAWFVRRQRGPFQSTDKAPPSLTGSIIGESLFQLLDTNESRSLSSQELASAMTALHRRDLDDDGTFGVGELNIASSDRFIARPAQPTTVGVRPFVTLVPGAAPLSILTEIERRYAVAPTVTPDGRNTLSRILGPDELGFEADVFDRYDLDADSTLDRDELREMIRHPHPTIELIVRLGKTEDQKSKVEIIRTSEAQNISVRRSSDGLVSIVIGDVQIEIVESIGGPDVARQYLLRQFTAADADQNEYLDENEAARNGAFRSSFDQFDEDGDGKLFAEELKTAVDGRTRAARSRTRMDVRNRGRDLFQILDSDRNRSLGRRELARAVKRIELWDTDSDGEVSESEIPQLYQLSFGPGQPQFRGVQIPGQAMQNANDGASTNSVAPLWFRKLDRNEDGELARREFPGSLTEFQTLDQNSDRVIDTAEAEFVKPVGR